ncbi:hypothetical protein [uncultured Cohaesibacter sp.]|uniref:hypothetical protein n=1 Tax=uncultured Cohaesibacter sp. TaxID=1002546 RepID=UPI00292FE7F3|nr:hypothetical protein [uncultured Cohaesibacter sp.]
MRVFILVLSLLWCSPTLAFDDFTMKAKTALELCLSVNIWHYAGQTCETVEAVAVAARGACSKSEEKLLLAIQTDKSVPNRISEKEARTMINGLFEQAKPSLYSSAIEHRIKSGKRCGVQKKRLLAR